MPLSADPLAASTLAAAADRLRTAARTATPCTPIRDLIAPDDVASAYAVQQSLIADRVRMGRRVVGRKIGLTSPAVRRQLGVDQPDFGVLLDDMQCQETGAIAMNRLLQPRIEAELAFVLSADIDDPDATAASVRSAVEHAVAALEIVDSRIAGWDITLADTVADNASSALFVLGVRPVPLTDVTPAEVTMTMRRGDEVVSEGTGSACLGDPLNALAWLARAAVAYGDPLKAGQVVLSGALGPMVPVTPGASFHAEISGLGTVSAHFDEETP